MSPQLLTLAKARIISMMEKRIAKDDMANIVFSRGVNLNFVSFSTM